MSRKKPKTLCTECVYFVNMGTTLEHKFCMHPELLLSFSIDPVTGNNTYFYYTIQKQIIRHPCPYPYASDINDGNCSFFSKDSSIPTYLGDNEFLKKYKNLGHNHSED